MQPSAYGVRRHNNYLCLDRILRWRHSSLLGVGRNRFVPKLLVRTWRPCDAKCALGDQCPETQQEHCVILRGKREIFRLKNVRNMTSPANAFSSYPWTCTKAGSRERRKEQSHKLPTTVHPSRPDTQTFPMSGSSLTSCSPSARERQSPQTPNSNKTPWRATRTTHMLLFECFEYL